MFETNEFRERLTEAILNEAGQNQMEQYQTAIIDYLVRLATENEPILMESEMTKTASARRGVPDALQSARAMIKHASAIASADKRTLLRESDIQAAYSSLYCHIWPFCR